MNRARPVRAQAARTLLIILRYNTKEVQRKWIRDTLIARLCYAQSCYTRHIFVKMCIHALDIFSNKYFKEFFYMPLLGLLDDRVNTVRLCVTAVIPYLKVMLTAEDRKLQQCLDSAISKLENSEKNKEIVLSYRNKMRDLRNIEKQFKVAEEKRKQEEEIKIAEGKPLPIFRPGFSASGQKVPSYINLPKDNTKGTAQTALGPKGPAPTGQSAVARSSISIAPGTGQPMQQHRPAAPVQAPAPPAPGPVTRPASAVVQPKPIEAPISDMSFLEQHFYIDAGINLTKTQNLNNLTLKVNPNGEPIQLLDIPPISLSETVLKSDNENKKVDFNILNKGTYNKHSEIKVDDNLANATLFLEEEYIEEHNLPQISTISLENIDISKLSENDIKLIENTTTNITDDVKVNLRNISIRKQNKSDQERNVINKRYSSVYQENHTSNSHLKRRSLNINTELSKIPISFKNQRSNVSTIRFNKECTTISKKKDNCLQKQNSIKENFAHNSSNKRYSLELKNQYSLKLDVAYDTRESNKHDQQTTIINNEMPKITRKEPSSRIASGLPVLKKKAQSEMVRK